MIIVGVLAVGCALYYLSLSASKGHFTNSCSTPPVTCADGTRINLAYPNCNQTCPEEKAQELSEKEASCINSGGTVSMSLCCNAVSNFPNLCPVGPCGCAPEYSHEVKICECPKNFCFNGETCTRSLY